MNKTACIFGSTGLIGSFLLDQLANDERYERIIVFNRTNREYSNTKIKQIVADYESISNFKTDLLADEYYCCLGTTIKKAKTQEAFEYVDYGLPLQIGKIAIEKNVNKYLVVSSIGASHRNKNFYLRTKGKMELEVAGLGIKNPYFFRPSILLGERSEKRFGESFGQAIMKAVGFLLFGRLKKYKAIHARTVAGAMVYVASKDFDKQVINSDEIEKLGRLHLKN